MHRIGIGYDVHQLTEGRKLILGGVEIPFHKGLLGHSDADVLIHTIMDAILGALGRGDIGRHFPDNDPKYKDISSRVLLREVAAFLKKEGYQIVNIDSVIVAQAPKMLPYIEQMKENIAEDLEIERSKINIKATTTEWLGFEGRGEGISSQAVVLITKVDHPK
ncbi:MAG: 2-C-methyl-D-erythritol 2,4-cyclodiphosphate synthase [Peptostreptococcaceae bacterium]|nr:2-C-methyl-D-erythritol 2,4-cyclodiphosphate synthase [Peptostreptococcaceae bacterium]